MVDPFDLMMFNKQDTISVEKRVEYYKKWFEDCKAVKLLKGFEFPVDRIEALHDKEIERSNSFRYCTILISLWKYR